MKFPLVAIALFLFFSLSLVAQQSNQVDKNVQRIILNGREYYLHIIQPSEGLYRISVNYGVSMQEIINANEDVENNLKPGQILRIPVISGRNSNESERTASSSFIYHTVEKGQTAFFVSRKYNIAVEQLFRHNPGADKGLVEGAILTIPISASDAQTKASVSVQKTSKVSDYVYHVVKPQETLFGLSRLYNVSVETIIDSNPALRNGILAIGSEVRIPSASQKPISIQPTTAEQPQFIQSGDYLYHNILQGQTFYSISRQYQISVDELKAANKGVTQDDLKVGYMLRVPKPDLSDKATLQQMDASDLFSTHRVRRRETLYGISRQYHVDIEVIKDVNSDVDFSDLKVGTNLRIPNNKWFSAKTAKALTTQHNAQLYKNQVDATATYGECARNSIIGFQVPVKVALMLPFGARESGRYISSGADSLKVTRDVRAATSRAKDFSEFYGGVLLALDSLKQRGVNVELSVYDIAPDSNAVRRALNDPWIKDANLIIGPAFANELPMVSDFSRQNKIPLVFPLSNTNPQLRSNPYLFHINTPDSLVFNNIADEIVRQSAGGNLLIIKPHESEHQANRLVQIIKQKVSMHSMGDSRIQYAEYTPTADDLVEIQALISADKRNFVVVPSVRAADVSKIIPILYGVKEKTKADINLFGMSDWLRFQTIEPEQVHYLNGTIFRSFGLDYSLPATNSFIRKYRQWYNTEPHAVSSYFMRSDATSSFSRYGVWGYDVANFFISAIVQYGNNFDVCLNMVENSQIQFNFDFKRISNWGGYYNSGLYMIKFKPDLSTERIPLK